MKPFLRKTGYLATVVLLGSYALFTLRGPNGIPALMEKRNQVHELEVQRATLAAEIQQKRDRIEKLKTSKSEQELAIKERLRLVAPNETQFVLPEPADNSAKK